MRDGYIRKLQLLPLQHSLNAFKHGKLKFLEAKSLNTATEQSTFSSSLALRPSAQQSQHSRKSSPPTKGLNELHGCPWLNEGEKDCLKRLNKMGFKLFHSHSQTLCNMDEILGSNRHQMKAIDQCIPALLFVVL